MDEMHTDPPSKHIGRTNLPCRSAETSRELAWLWTPATPTRQKPLNFQSRTQGNPTELQSWEQRSTGISWACVLSCLWKRLHHHPLTYYMEPLWVTRPSALWDLIKAADVSAEKLPFLPGKLGPEEAPCVMQSLSRLSPTNLSHIFLILWLSFIFFSAHPPRRTFWVLLALFCILCIRDEKCWKEKSGLLSGVVPF